MWMIFATLAVAVVTGSLILSAVVTLQEAARASESLLPCDPSECAALPVAPRFAEAGDPCPAMVWDMLAAERVRAQLLRNLADSLGTVAWSTYAASPALHAGKRVLLTNADFANGTLRITEPAYLQLTEDIAFAPNAAHDYRPHANQTQYHGAAYRLDFFAAIAIEAANVTLDGQGYEMRQGTDHYVQQRFFAHVELGDRPFVPPQGPANFGSSFTPAAYTVIRNVTFGLSSHQAIHGNMPVRTYIANCTFSDYEVAAISLNGPVETTQEGLQLQGIRRDIPVIGTYSHGRFLRPLVHRLLHQYDTNATITAGLSSGKAAQAATRAQELSDAMAILNTQMDDAFADLTAPGSAGINATLHPEAHALFANPGNLVGGSAYGLLYHGQGVAVNGFFCSKEQTAASATQSLLLYNSVVAETYANVSEVIALAHCPSPVPDPTTQCQTCYAQIGPIGEVLRVADVTDAAGNYVPGNALFEVQIAVARLLQTLALLRPSAPTLAIDDAVINWTRTGTPTLTEMVASGNFTYYRNGDAMFHVNKGVMGIRQDGGDYYCLVDVNVTGTANVGRPSRTVPLPGEQAGVGYNRACYTGALDGGHPLQFPLVGHTGAHARGISATAACNVYYERVRIDGVSSLHGWARGLDAFHGSQPLSERSLVIRNVTAPQEAGAGLWPVCPTARSAIGHCTSNLTAPFVYQNDTLVESAVQCAEGLLGQCFARAVYPEAEEPQRCELPCTPSASAAATHTSTSSGRCPYRAYEPNYCT